MGRPTNKEKWRQNISKAMSKMTPENIQKLKEAFALGCSIEEACFYTDISNQTYYNWIEKKPELFDEFERLKQKPVLMARQAVVQGLPGDKHFSYQFLKAKRPQEFAAERVAIEHSGVVASMDIPESYKSADNARIRIKEELLKSIHDAAMAKSKIK